jgi:hypothetical protein
MNSYILRIYREEENNPRNFVGTVEEAAAGEKQVFTSLDELWAILNPAEKGKKRKTDEQRQT